VVPPAFARACWCACPGLILAITAPPAFLHPVFCFTRSCEGDPRTNDLERDQDGFLRQGLPARTIRWLSESRPVTLSRVGLCKKDYIINPPLLPLAAAKYNHYRGSSAWRPGTLITAPPVAAEIVRITVSSGSF